jgi:hypothetical protein
MMIRIAVPISEIATDPRHPIRLLKKSTYVVYPVAARPVVYERRPWFGAATVDA